MRQKVFPLPTVGAPSASNSPSGLDNFNLRVFLCVKICSANMVYVIIIIHNRTIIIYEQIVKDAKQIVSRMLECL